MNADEIVRVPVEHEFKCWPEYYDAVERGEKPFEIRKWDRPYRVGDTLLFRRYDPKLQDYTGEQMQRKITYLLDMTYLPGEAVPHFTGYVVLGLDYPQADLIESLQAQLAASQRREKAAAEAILTATYHHQGCCSVCNYAVWDEEMETWLCTTKKEWNRHDCFEWSGSQEADK